MLDLSKPVTQSTFADLVGISQQAVSELVVGGVLPMGESAAHWLLRYSGRLREQAAGRLGAVSGIDLVAERAQLARAQRESAELRNAETRGDLIRVDAVRTAWARKVTEIREGILALPARSAALVAAESDLERCHELLEIEAHALLANLSSSPQVQS